jgi:hypothetical protein
LAALLSNIADQLSPWMADLRSNMAAHPLSKVGPHLAPLSRYLVAETRHLLTVARLLAPAVHLLAPAVHSFAPAVHLLAPEVRLLAPEVHLLAPALQVPAFQEPPAVVLWRCLRKCLPFPSWSLPRDRHHLTKESDMYNIDREAHAQTKRHPDRFMYKSNKKIADRQKLKRICLNLLNKDKSVYNRE